eukprot:5710071-Prymnesium_polylepis.2
MPPRPHAGVCRGPCAKPPLRGVRPWGESREQQAEVVAMYDGGFLKKMGAHGKSGGGAAAHRRRWMRALAASDRAS